MELQYPMAGSGLRNVGIPGIIPKVSRITSHVARYYWVKKSRRMMQARYTARIVKITNAYTIFFGKYKRKEPLEISKCGCDDNIRMDLKNLRVWFGFFWLRIVTGSRPF
jgi:hypothetical protein